MATYIEKTMVGWEEWCALPDLGLPALKAKIDTGAKTSALHAYDIESFIKNEENYVRFKIHPLHRNAELERICEAPLIDRRSITSSNGERETRYVIYTILEFSTVTIPAEITLTSRHNMAFRMLLGREALRRGGFTVDPGRSCLLGKRKNVAELYS